MQPIADSSPYICITSDTHAGASIDAYGEHVDRKYRQDFEAWRGLGPTTAGWQSSAAAALAG